MKVKVKVILEEATKSGRGVAVQMYPFFTRTVRTDVYRAA